MTEWISARKGAKSIYAYSLGAESPYFFSPGEFDCIEGVTVDLGISNSISLLALCAIADGG